MDLGMFDEARSSFQRAIELKPDHSAARWNLSLLLLLLGDLQNGWVEYESRWLQKQFIPLHTDHPLWEGERLDGKTILIHAEQGLELLNR